MPFNKRHLHVFAQDMKKQEAAVSNLKTLPEQDLYFYGYFLGKCQHPLRGILTSSLSLLDSQKKKRLKGHMDSIQKSIMCLLSGQSTASENERAIAQLKSNDKKLENTVTCYVLAVHYESVRTDLAMFYFERAQSGEFAIADASYRMSKLEKDSEKSQRLLFKAASLSHPAACYDVAVRLYRSDGGHHGGTKMIKKALSYLNVAVAYHEPRAIQLYALLCKKTNQSNISKIDLNKTK